MSPRDDVDEKIDELEQMAEVLMSKAQDLRETAARLRDLVSRGDQRSP
jgi:DNA-binding response OmpR family regulator